MNKEELRKEIITFSNLNGTSGFEHNVRAYLIEILSKFTELKIEQDNLGSLLILKEGTLGKKGKTISFMAHMDEVGFILTNIDDDGFGYFNPIGGWWSHVLLGQKIKLLTNKKEEIIAVVAAKPKNEDTLRQGKVLDLDELYLDFGAKNKKEILNWGVEIGNQIVPYQKTAITSSDGNRIIGKALDDRVSLVACLHILERLSKIEHKNNILIVASVQEEVGLRGARTSTYKNTPDIAIAIDVTFSNDTPDVIKDDIRLGKGISLLLKDRRSVANPRLFNFVRNTAINKEIAYSVDAFRGGTDTGNIQIVKEGVPAMSIAIPLRYMHSHNSIIDLADVEATIDLGVQVVLDLDDKAIEEIKNNYEN